MTEDTRRNLLSRRFSYTDQDLTVLSWEAALVLEPAAADQDVEFLLEFANAQLLELRVYDAYLDAELPQLYDRASLARRGPAALLVRRFEHVLAGLHTLVADTTEVVERVENGLKVTNDVYPGPNLPGGARALPGGRVASGTRAQAPELPRHLRHAERRGPDRPRQRARGDHHPPHRHRGGDGPPPRTERLLVVSSSASTTGASTTCSARNQT